MAILQVGNLKIDAELKLVLSGAVSEVTGRLRSVADALAGKTALAPADLHTLQPHKGCSPESCEIEEVRKHEAEQVEEIQSLQAESARKSMTIEDLIFEKAADKRLIESLRGEIQEFQSKLPGSSVSTLPVLTPDEREVDGSAGHFSEEPLLKMVAGSDPAAGINGPTSASLTDPPIMGDERTSGAASEEIDDTDHAFERATDGDCVICGLSLHSEKASQEGGGSSQRDNGLPAKAPMAKGPEVPAQGTGSTTADQQSAGKAADGGQPTTAADAKTDLYEQAVTAISDMAFVSISLLQRKLRIGFNVSKDLLDKMEKNGLIEAADGFKPRKVLKACAATNASRQSDAADHLSPTESPRVDQRGCGLVGSGTDVGELCASVRTAPESTSVPDVVAAEQPEEDAATIARRALAARDAATAANPQGGYRPRHFVFDGCPPGGVGVADFWGSIGAAAQKAREYIAEEAKRDPAWAMVTARAISDEEAKAIEDAIAEKELDDLDAEINSEGDCHPVASGLALRDGDETPAERTRLACKGIKGESPAKRGEPTSDERKPNAPGEVAAHAAESTPVASPVETAQEAERTQSETALRGASNPDNTATGSDLENQADGKAAHEQQAVPNAGLAPDLTNLSGIELGVGGGSVARPASVVQKLMWGHNAKGSAWHLWGRTVVTTVDDKGKTTQRAVCDEVVEGEITHADRPVLDNACQDCLAIEKDPPAEPAPVQAQPPAGPFAGIEWAVTAVIPTKKVKPAKAPAVKKEEGEPRAAPSETAPEKKTRNTSNIPPHCLAPEGCPNKGGPRNQFHCPDHAQKIGLQQRRVNLEAWKKARAPVAPTPAAESEAAHAQG